MYGRQATSSAVHRHHPRAPRPVVEGEQEAEPGRGDHEQQPGPHAGPEEHRERNPDEHDGAAEVGLLEHEEEGRADDGRGHQQVAERARRLLPAREIAGQHQHRGHLGQLGRLPDLVPADREPAVAALRRPGAGAHGEHDAEENQAERVERGRAATPAAGATCGTPPTRPRRRCRTRRTGGTRRPPRGWRRRSVPAEYRVSSPKIMSQRLTESSWRSRVADLTARPPRGARRIGRGPGGGRIGIELHRPGGAVLDATASSSSTLTLIAPAVSGPSR